MKEILCLQVGQCGNNVGRQFWEVLCNEHGIDQTGAYAGSNQGQLDRISTYFREKKGLHYTPRSVMIDLDRNSLDVVRATPYGAIYMEENFLFGQDDASNNWAKGHLTEGNELCDSCLNVIRREVEACDCFHGFQSLHSIAGGTGGGLGSLLFCKLKDEYPSRLINTYSFLPALKVSEKVVEPYNSLLTINHLIESTAESHCIDNEALFWLLSNNLNLKNPDYDDLNYQVSLVMSGISSTLRFPSTTNADFRKTAVNMVPFPRLHFFIPGLAPVIGRMAEPLVHCKRPSLKDLTQSFSYKSLFAGCQFKAGKFLTMNCIFRGQLPSGEVEKHMYNFKNKHSVLFAEWIPNNIKSSICYTPVAGVHVSATFVANTTAIQDIFKRIRAQYLTMYRRKAFIHWYLEEGLEELEFEMAESNLSDLIAEYQASADMILDTAVLPEKPCLDPVFEPKETNKRSQ